MKSDNDQYYKSVPTDSKDEYKIPKSLPGFGVRHAQMLILFICVTVIIVSRAHLGVTIVAMTSLNNETIVNNTVDNNTDIMQNDETKNNSLNNISLIQVSYETYQWPKPVQEMVLSSFFLGYFIMMLPIGMICQRFGGKIPLQASLLVNGIVCASTPLLTSWGGWRAMCACRVLQGLSQAGLFPSMQTLLAQWAPLSERGTLSSYVYTGTTFGTIIGFQLAGVLSDTAWGWPVTFYVIGVLCLICFVFMTVLGSSSPQEHKTISEEEKNFIKGHSGPSAGKKNNIPWKSILTSRPVWASFCTHVGSGATFIFLLTQVPSYIHYIYGINVKDSAYLSSLPYIFNLLSSATIGIVSDFFTNRNIVSIKNARRISNSIAQVGVALGLIGTSFASNTVVAITCIVLSMAMYSGIHTGFMVNYLDIAPNYSGAIFAIGNTLCNVVILMLPIVISNIVLDVTNVYHWRTMLSIIAGLSFFTNLVFVTFMSAKVQPWNNEHKQSDDATDMKKDVEELKVL